MESAGRLHDPEPYPARATSELARRGAQGGDAGRVSGTQERWPARHPNALARFAAPRRSHRDVETPHSYGTLTPGVQPKIWVTISPMGEGYISDSGTRGVQPKMWDTLSPLGRGRPAPTLSPARQPTDSSAACHISAAVGRNQTGFVGAGLVPTLSKGTHKGYRRYNKVCSNGPAGAYHE